ncbi:amidase [Pedobacter sp. PAMC26386]|nr:amidase [Pedobacter sp. PAMC26386]
MKKNFGQYSIFEMGQKLRAGMLSCIELTETILNDIKDRNPYLKAFAVILEERALQEAAQAQKDFNNGLDRGPLHGIPYAVKGIFDVEGYSNTAGMHLPVEHIALADAASISLLKRAGAVLVGHTNTSPLAATILGINHIFGTPHNPWKIDPYIPGGSSSGSAVAVAAGMVPFALGSDTGGSIRVPASLCGVVGFKPTVGWVDTQGVWPLAPGLDTIGIISHSAGDVKTVYSVLMNNLQQKKTVLKNLRIGLCKTVFFDNAESEVVFAVEKAAELLSNLVADVSPVEIPVLRKLRELMKETSFIASEAYPLHKEIIEAPDNDWVLDWLKAGGTYTHEQVVNARKQYTKIAKKLSFSNQHSDVLIVPATPSPAVLVSACDSPESHAQLSALLSRNTLMANLAGWCSISVPCGITEKGLPIGLMICADAHREDIVIQIAEAFEEASGFRFQSMVPKYTTVN